MLETRSKIWWNDITGPSQFISAVAAGLFAGKSVVMLVPEDLPWRHEMRSAAEGLLREKDDELDIQYIDCNEETEHFAIERSAIAEYLLGYASPDVQNGYRSSGGYSIQKYLLDNQVLLKKILWVKGMNRKQALDWLAFCKDYRSRSQYDGLFVLESYEEMPVRGIGSNVLFVRYKDYVSYYDALLFNNMLVSALDLSMEWKKYIATVVTSLCNCNVQLSEVSIASFNKSVSPLSCLTGAVEESECREEKSASQLTHDHPLHGIDRGCTEQMEKKVWHAQLQILFPIIEVERMSMIERHYTEIAEALSTPHMNHKGGRTAAITQFGEMITQPYKTELGTIYRMTCLRKADDQTQYLFYLPKEKDRERLTLLHRMRNGIAHGVVCDNDDVMSLLDEHPYKW